MNQLWHLNTLVAALTIAAVGCGGGGSFKRGSLVRGDADTVLYYPDPDVSSDAASLASLQQSATGLGCAAAVINGQLGVNCPDAGGDLVFAANSHDSSVVQVGCLKGVTEAKCEATAVKIISGRK